MKIRLWKLGSLEHKILPTQKRIQEFRDVLKEWTEKDGEYDLVWGPEITVELVEIEDDVKNYIVNEEGKLELVEPDKDKLEYFVVRKSSVDKYGPGMMKAINSGSFANGGKVNYLQGGGNALFRPGHDEKASKELGCHIDGVRPVRNDEGVDK